MLICIESDGELHISLGGLPPIQWSCLFQSEQMGKKCFEDTALLLVVGSCV